MKLPQKFPQFEDEKALIVVAGQMEADFYLLFNGEINKISSFKVEKPRYSDREGFVVRRAGGITIGGGPSYNVSKEKIKIEFSKEFKKAIKPLLSDKKISRIYLFAESYVVNEIKDLLSSFSGQLKLIGRGNYLKTKPLDLLEKIFSK